MPERTVEPAVQPQADAGRHHRPACGNFVERVRRVLRPRGALTPRGTLSRACRTLLRKSRSAALPDRLPDASGGLCGAGLSRAPRPGPEPRVAHASRGEVSQGSARRRTPAAAARRLVRRWLAVFVFASLALCSIGVPVHAQTVTLISNASQGNDSQAGDTRTRAQLFTTGTNAAGYTLASVEIVSKDAQSDDVTVSVCETDSSGHPTSTCTALTAPSSFAAGTLSFTAPDNTTLSAGTTYAVQIVSPGDDNLLLGATTSNDEDAGGADDWTIGDGYVLKIGDSWFSISSAALRITINGEAKGGSSNNAPVFDPDTATRTIAENTAADTNIGAVIPEATDADSGDTLMYTMEGTDAASFGFDAATRQIKTKAALDHEAKSSYTVTIKASDGTDSDTMTVTINVTDADEPPVAPGAPGVTATSGSTTSLDVSWTAPANTGKPAITSYDLQYRVGSSGSFTAGPQDVTTTSAAITGLTAGTTYEVQVRATNAEGDGPWSPSGEGSTGSASNNAPTVANAIPNQTATVGVDFSYAFPANTFADADSDTLSYTATLSDDSALPSWLGFTDGTRTFAGNPQAGDAGTLSVKVTADDGNDGTVSDTFDIAVAASTAGICGRTVAVQTAILAKITGVSNCAAVTDTHLAAVTGTLNLISSSLTGLNAGDFDGLTALTTLWLNNNSLTELPSGLFDENTALTTLWLRVNSLTALPSGLFDKNTKLTSLTLNNNSLSTLPSDIFKNLTALTALALQVNTGAPFKPVANAGADRTASTGAAVTLAGAATGPWGDNVTWQWTQVDGASSNTAVTDGVTLTGADSASASFTAPDAAATLYFRLIATPVPGAESARGRVASAPDWVTVTVEEAANNAPTVANAIPNQTATVGVDFSYAFPANTFADADSDTLSYTATLSDDSDLPSWLGFTDSTRTFAGLPQAADAGTLSVKVTADDGNGGTVSDTFDIAVAASTAGICGRTVAVQTAILARITGVSNCAAVTDTHLAAITGSLSLGSSSLTGLKAGDFDGLTALQRLLLNNNSLSALPSGLFDDLTALTTLQLNNNSLSTLPSDIFDKLTALTALALQNNPGAPFKPTANAGTDQSVTTGAAVTLAGTATGPWGDNVTWQWTQVDGASSNTPVTTGVTLAGATSASASFTAPDAATTLHFRLIATPVRATSIQGLIASGPDWVTVTVEEAANNAPTVANAIPNQTATVGVDFSYAFPANTFADADSDTLSYTATLSDDSALPSWLSFTDSTRTFAGLPQAADAGTISVKVTASDGNGGTVSDTFDIAVAASTAGICGRTIAVQEAIVVRISNNCAAVTDAILATVSGTLDITNSSLTGLKAGDFDGLTMLTRLFLDDNSLTALPSGIFDENTALLILRLNNNSLASLPSGIFDNLTRLTAVSLNDNSLSALPSDVFDKNTALTALALHNNTGAPFKPTANAGADRTASTGAAVTLAGAATGPWGDNVTWQWTQVDGASSNTPVTSGVTLTGADSASASFTAPAAAATLHFRLVATPKPGADSTQGRVASAPDWVTVTVAEAANNAPTVANAIPDQDATVGVDFSYAFPANTFADADSDTLSYTATLSDDSALPSWLGFTDSTRTFAGNPQAGDAGTLSVKVTADDGNGGTVSDTFDIAVAASTAGICGRTVAVQTAILARISGIGNCAAVTATHLAAIDATLNLASSSLTGLKAGDFDGLTGLTALHLNNNSLTALPPGIFDDLAALVLLDLNDNSLAALPSDVFDKNTALTTLALRNNPGAPFRPAANAGADRTAATGGAVTLAGAATGPWGDNVTWQWTQVDGASSNTPVTDGVTLTGADSASASFTAPDTETTLHFRLVATPVPGADSTEGRVASEPDWITVTVAVSVGEPDPPTELRATAGRPAAPDGTAHVDLAWTVPGDEGDTAVSGYAVERSADVDPRVWQTLVADTGSRRTAYRDAGLGSEVTWHYRVSAINSNGQSQPSAVASATTGDVRAPAPVRMRVPATGTTVEIDFDEDLDAGSAPSASAFAVTVAGAPRALSGVDPVSLSRATVTLALSAPVTPGQAVTVSYTRPAANPLRDAAGNEAESFADRAVTNGTGRQLSVRLVDKDGRPTTAAEGRVEVYHSGAWGLVCDDLLERVDNHAPRVMCASTGRYTDGEWIANPGEQLGARWGPAPAGQPFVLDDLECSPGTDSLGRCRGMFGAAGSRGNPRHNCRIGEEVWLRCSDGEDPNPGVGPAVLRASTGTFGLAVFILFDSSLQSAPGKRPAMDAFEVTVNGEPAELREMQVSRITRTVALHLHESFGLGDVVKVSYTDPDPGADNASGALEDKFGDDAASFGPMAVENLVVDKYPPRFVFGEVSADGLTVTLRFTEDLDKATLPAPERFTVRVVDRVKTAEPIPVETNNDVTPKAVKAGTARDELLLEMTEAIPKVPLVEGTEDTTKIPVIVGHKRVYVRYADLTSGDDAQGVVQDFAGNDAASTHFVGVRNLSTVEEVADAEPEALTASFGDLPTRHTGAAFTVPLTFSEAFAVTEAQLRAGLAVTGGALTTVAPATAGETRNWNLTVTPTAAADAVTITLTPKESCAVENAICTADARGLSEAVTAEVPGRAPTQVVSARVTGDAGGDGVWDTGETVTVEVTFNRAVGVQGNPAASPTVGVTLDGTRREAALASGRAAATTHRFEYAVTGDDDGAKVARVVADGITTDDAVFGDNEGHEATLGFSTPGISVADASATEGPTATADFTVTLAPAASEDVSVDYATADGTAVAGDDYTSVTGTVTFAPGETSKTVSVRVLDDAVEDAGETFALVLGNPQGAHAYLARTRAAATVNNDDTATAPLTASFADVPAGHGGDAFTFELAFSESPELSYRVLKDADGAIAVTGGRVTRAPRIEQGSNQRWRITVRPDEGADAVSLTLPATADCEAANAICTADGRPLSAAVTATVPRDPPAQAPVTPLTVSFENVPAEHDGASRVTFRVVFSKKPDPGYSYRTMRDETLAITQGGQPLAAKRAKRLNKPHNDRWEIAIDPVSKADIEVAIAATADCAAAGAVCTEGGEALSNAVSAAIPGPPGLSVADAQVEEGPDAALDFAVTLSRASTEVVTVDYATSDVSAVAGADYTRTTGTLTFTPGETAKTVSVPVLDDAHDDGGETFTLTLSNPSGGNAWLEDASATGTIENADAMPRAWIARFGRTVGTQAVEAVTGRLGGGGQTHVTLGGRSLPLGTGEASLLTDETTPGDDLSPMAHDGTGEVAKEAGEVEKAVAEWLRSSMGEDGELVLPDLDTLMLGSSFNLSLGDRGAGSGSQRKWSVWGRFARDSFEGAAEGLSLEGDVTTGFVGMDVESGSWLWGAALGISDGEGPYRMAEDGATAPPEDETPGMSGRMESNMTAVYPYGRYAVTDRLDLWAMGGYGEGTMIVEAAGGSPLETDLGLTLGAIGARGNLKEPPPEGGIALILRADALWVRTESEALRSGSGFLSAATADTSRMRLILEGERAYRLPNGGTLTPALELGVRRDGGDAETGTGIEAGARVSFKRQNLAVEGAVRTLLSHEDEEYGEWGASASIRLEPGRDGRGLSFSVAPSWGATGSAAERLWGLDDTRGLASDGEFEAGRRIDARVGYGLPVFGGRFTGTPEFGLGLSDGAREYRIGWRLSPVGGGIGPFASFGIHMEAVREVPSRGESESRFGVVLEARF